MKTRLPKENTTLLAAVGDTDIAENLEKGHELNGVTYKVREPFRFGPNHSFP